MLSLTRAHSTRATHSTTRSDWLPPSALVLSRSIQYESTESHCIELRYRPIVLSTPPRRWCEARAGPTRDSNSALGGSYSLPWDWPSVTVLARSPLIRAPPPRHRPPANTAHSIATISKSLWPTSHNVNNARVGCLPCCLVVSLGVDIQRARMGIVLDTFLQTKVMVSEKPSQAWSILLPCKK